jgi:hypothetical protein
MARFVRLFPNRVVELRIAENAARDASLLGPRVARAYGCGFCAADRSLILP